MAETHGRDVAARRRDGGERRHRTEEHQHIHSTRTPTFTQAPACIARAHAYNSTHVHTSTRVTRAHTSNNTHGDTPGPWPP
jgi:hypothetical protein